MTDSLSDTAIVDALKQWSFSNPSKPKELYSKSTFEGPAARNYNLKNKKVRKFLQSEKQDVGINLGWTDDAEPATGKKVARWFFTRSGAQGGPLKYGEALGLAVGRQPSWIRQKKRPVGVNLDWSEKPVIEWVLAGGVIGQPVKPGQYLAIYNQVSGEFLVYFDRTAGADIGWPSSKTWGTQISEKLIEEAKKQAVELLIKGAAA